MTSSQKVDTSTDYYAVLELSPTASNDEIKHSFRRLALKYHPDKVGDDETLVGKFDELRKASDFLLDATARQQYDNARLAQQQRTARAAASDERDQYFKNKLEAAERAHQRKQTDEDERAESIARARAFGAELKTRYARKRAREAQAELERPRNTADVAEARLKQDLLARTLAMSAPDQGTLDQDTLDRAIVFRFPGGEGEKPSLTDLQVCFSHFGPVEDVVILPKRVKFAINSHNPPAYKKAMVIFQDLTHARDASTGILNLAKKKQGEFWGIFYDVRLGSEPEPSKPSRAKSDLHALAIKADLVQEKRDFGSKLHQRRSLEERLP